MYTSHPVAPSPWDDVTLGFGSDVLPGNYIELLCLPYDSFTIMEEQRVPMVVNMHALLAADMTITSLGPFDDTDADMEVLWTRCMVPVLTWTGSEIPRWSCKTEKHILEKIS